MYDPSIGRWNGVDALAKKAHGWTPYQYEFNNPLKYTDPSGNLESHYVDENGKYLGQDKTGTSDVRVISREDWENLGGLNEAEKTEGTVTAVLSSTPLQNYGPQGGIEISDATMEEINDAGGVVPEPTVVNESDNEAAYEVEENVGKEESPNFIEDGTAIKLNPGKSTYIPIDGVKTILSNPGGVHEGMVFRVAPGGGTVTVGQDGEVSERRGRGGAILQGALELTGRDYGWVRRNENNDNWGQLVRIPLKGFIK